MEMIKSSHVLVATHHSVATSLLHIGVCACLMLIPYRLFARGETGLGRLALIAANGMSYSISLFMSDGGAEDHDFDCMVLYILLLNVIFLLARGISLFCRWQNWFPMSFLAYWKDRERLDKVYRTRQEALEKLAAQRVERIRERDHKAELVEASEQVRMVEEKPKLTWMLKYRSNK